MNLDAVLEATAAATAAPVDSNINHKAKAEAATMAPAQHAAPVVVTTELAETTFLALAEFYDNRRDKAVMQLAQTLSGYGAELQKKGNGMTAAIAAPFLAEARRLLEASEKLNVSAARNRKLYNEAK